MLQACLHSLGQLFIDSELPRQACIYLRRALRVAESHGGPHHPTVASSLSDLAIILHKKGRLLEAERSLRRALDIHRGVHPPDHPDVIANLKSLAAVLIERHCYAEAEVLMRTALQTDIDRYGDNSSIVTADRAWLKKIAGLT